VSAAFIVAYIHLRAAHAARRLAEMGNNSRAAMSTKKAL
jgi:hypothetical protein